MTDPETPSSPTPDDASGTSSTPAPDVIIGLATDGTYSLLIAQFPTIDDAQAAYEALREVERTSRLRIDGVVIASCDAEGKVHLGKVTDHSTKTGLKWGIVGGVVMGLVFPPSILAGAAAMGMAGAGLGKVRNVAHRSELGDRLANVMTPNTAGIVALVEDTAMVEVGKALAKADRIVTEAVNKQIAAEIDREAALAKESLGA